jgi:uncharacterized membrane protein YhaH (DUF805 family)
MTLAEQIIQRRHNGKDTGTISSSHNSMSESLETWHHSVENESQRLEQQQKDLAARYDRIAIEQEKVNQLREHIAQANNLSMETKPSQARCDIGVVVSDGPIKGKQKCVTPILALKNFFINWTIKGRASRSEVWWIIVLFQFPLFILGRSVAQSDLTIPLRIISLILLWPSFCLEGRRFHDLGCNAAWGIGLGIVQMVAIFIHTVIVDSSVCHLVGWLIGFIFFLANISASQPCANQYGNVPNLKSK